MATPLRRCVGQAAIVLIALVPAWKIVEPYFRPGPKSVTEEASRLGRELFTHRWTEHDPLAKGDGLGPVFNASSCVECHKQGGTGGGGPIDNNVTVYSLVKPDPAGRIPQSGVVHQKAINPSFWETLDLVDASLPRKPSVPLSNLTDRKRPASRNVVITQRNTPALFGDGLIDSIAGDAIVSHHRVRGAAARIGVGASEVRGRVARLRDGRVGRFGWKLEFATIGEFVKAACANELGLSNPGQPQATSLAQPGYRPQGVDLSEEQCELITDFIRSLPRPVEVVPERAELASLANTGRALFRTIGCTDCHMQSLGSVRGLYSDLLLHDMGVGLESSGGYRGPVDSPPAIPDEKFEDSEQPAPTEWRTPPLWGVADSAPYLHDGRAPTLEVAIDAHGGEALSVTERFKNLSATQQQAVIAFLKTLRAPESPFLPDNPRTLAAR